MVSIGGKSLDYEDTRRHEAKTTRKALQNNGKLSLGQHNCAIIPCFRRANIGRPKPFAAHSFHQDFNRVGRGSGFAGIRKGNCLCGVTIIDIGVTTG
jgi:hypothetical protein